IGPFVPLAASWRQIGLERRAAVETPRRGPGRTGCYRVGDAAQRRRPRLQRCLPAQQIIEFLLELLLIEQLTAGSAVDPGTQFGDAIFVGVLLLVLARHDAPQQIVAEGEIGRGRDRPAGHDDDAADGDPERDRSEPDLPSGMGDRIAGAGSVGAPLAWDRVVPGTRRTVP